MALLSRIIPISSTDISQTGNARRQALSLANQMNFDDLRQGQLSIIVTEAARNIEAHGGDGEIILSPWTHQDLSGIDLLALDKGKGIASVSEALRDGYSTAGTPGNGLGAISRLSSYFQIYTAPGGGTALFARVLRNSQPAGREAEPGVGAYAAGSISIPITGETVCGDAWSAHFSPGRSLYVMADGLGHGILAAEAANEAIRIFHQASQYAPERILTEIHDALAKTRGAAVSVLEILPDRQVLNYAGVGNIVAAISHHGKSRGLVSLNGTVGHSIGRIQQFAYPWETGSQLIMHSDGLGTRWNLEQYPGLLSRHPALVAGVIFRDFCRKRDDATILVTRI